MFIRFTLVVSLLTYYFRLTLAQFCSLAISLHRSVPINLYTPKWGKSFIPKAQGGDCYFVQRLGMKSFIKRESFINKI